jgi:DNA repair protein RadC
MSEGPTMPDQMNYRIPRQRITLVRDGSLLSNWRIFSNSRQVFEFAREYLYSDADKELFHILMLDSKNRLVGVSLVSQGSISSSIVSPFDLFKAPIIANSPAIICTHNHPSLDPAPSREDRDCTVRLVKAGAILGIRVLDHIVCGGTDSFSFADAGILGDSLP